MANMDPSMAAMEERYRMQDEVKAMFRRTNRLVAEATTSETELDARLAALEKRYRVQDEVTAMFRESNRKFLEFMNTPALQLPEDSDSETGSVDMESLTESAWTLFERGS